MIRVLAVDDERDFLKLLQKRLAKRNLEIAVAQSGRDALEYMSANPVDVVVLDVKMPGMNGLDALQEMKKRHPDVEVIMLTGHGSVKSGLEGMSRGAYDYVLKPFTIDDLLERIRAAFERVRRNRSEVGA